MSDPKTNEKQERPLPTDPVHDVLYYIFPSLDMLQTAPLVYTCLLNYRQEPSCHPCSSIYASLRMNYILHSVSDLSRFLQAPFAHPFRS